MSFSGHDRLIFPFRKEKPRKQKPDSAERKNKPVCSGVLDYFPDALLAVAELSRIGNEQHNPGQPMHWAREKSGDEADALTRHLIDRGKIDADGVRHSTKVAWRALALLQKELEQENGLPLSRASK
jgi:dATP/dGTP diphosphohydrolase